MIPARHGLRELVQLLIMLSVERPETRLDPIRRLATEQVRELHRALVPLPRQHLRARHHRRHRIQLGAHIDRAEEHHLPLLELRAEAHHRVEERTPQAARRALHVPHMLREHAEIAV